MRIDYVIVDKSGNRVNPALLKEGHEIPVRLKSVRFEGDVMIQTLEYQHDPEQEG